MTKTNEIGRAAGGSVGCGNQTATTGAEVLNARTFNFMGEDVRVVTKDDGPWFVASDVCGVLGLQNPTKSISTLDDDERSNYKLGRQGDANIISEAGLYTLIMRSHKPKAKEFRRWVTHEVLPAINRSGVYGGNRDPASIAAQILDDPAVCSLIIRGITDQITPNDIRDITTAVARETAARDQFARADTIRRIDQRLTSLEQRVGVPLVEATHEVHILTKTNRGTKNWSCRWRGFDEPGRCPQDRERRAVPIPADGREFRPHARDRDREMSIRIQGGAEMTDVIQELQETKEILNSLLTILEYLDDVPEGCADLTRIAWGKLERVEHEFCFPGEEK